MGYLLVLTEFDMQDLAIVVTKDQIPALFAPNGLSGLIDRIEAEARSVAPDVSTKKGRDTIRTTAAKVAKTKTYLDGLGKDLTADLKRQTAAVDAERKAMRDRLDALKDEVRRPLTEWEQAEEDRIAGHRAMISEIMAACGYSAESASAELSASLSKIEAIEIGPHLQEFEAEAARAKDTATSHLRAAIKAAKTREAEAVELARLRAEAIAREQKEREERIARESAERAKAEAERIAREAAEEVERKAQAERLRAENERLQAERDRAEAERRAIEAEQRAKQAAADAERRAKEAEIEAQRREQQAAEQERARAKSEADRIAAEAANRAANEAHSLAIKRAVAGDLMRVADITGEQAKAIVIAIIRGEIANTEIRF